MTQPSVAEKRKELESGLLPESESRPKTKMPVEMPALSATPGTMSKPASSPRLRLPRLSVALEAAKYLERSS